MLTIRFQRVGRRNDPSFKIVVGEHTKHPQSGSQYAILGSYNPKTKVATLKADEIKGWLAKGAKASGTVHNLLITKGVIEGKKINVLQKRSIKKEGEEVKVEAAPAAAPAAQTAPEAVAAEMPSESEVPPVV